MRILPSAERVVNAKILSHLEKRLWGCMRWPSVTTERRELVYTYRKRSYTMPVRLAGRRVGRSARKLASASGAPDRDTEERSTPLDALANCRRLCGPPSSRPIYGQFVQFVHATRRDSAGSLALSLPQISQSRGRVRRV